MSTRSGDTQYSPLTAQLETGIHIPTEENADSQVISFQNHGSRQIPVLKKVLGVNRKYSHIKKKGKNAFKKHLHTKLKQKVVIGNIYNMSNFSLSDHEIDILNRGLSFIGAPKSFSVWDISKAYSDFRRRMLLHYHFYINPTNYLPKKFRKKSNWQPPNHNQLSIQNFLLAIKKDILAAIQNPRVNLRNLSQEEQTALLSLKNNKEFIIKPADKGGKIVLWPIQSYLVEAYKQLGNQLHYEQIEANPTPGLAMEIETFLTHLETRGTIDSDCHKFLSPSSETSTPTFYMLPKIHKPNSPGQPIISGCQSPARALSQYLDFYLKPIFKEIPSYMKDTNNFLEIIFTLGQEANPGDYLVTLDVKSLYTNITQDEGIEYCLTTLQEYYHDRLPIPIRYLKQIFNFVLKQNFFEFDNKYYRQIDCTAMGSPFAPNFANIFTHCGIHI